MVSPRQRASILKARAQAERPLKRYASLIAKARQALKQQEPDIQKAVAAATPALRQTQGLFRWLDDLLMLFDQRAPEDQRKAAAQRLARSLPATFKDPNVYPALRRLRKELKRDGYGPARANLYGWVFPLAAEEAARDAFNPQFIRFGRTWVKDHRGLKMKVIPAELPFYDRYVWLQQRVYRNAAALIKDHPAHDVQLGDEPIERGPSPEAQLLEAGRASDFVALLGEGNAPVFSEVMSKLTPRERQVFLSYLDGLSTAEIASDLGIAHSTVRVHRRNAHRKLDPQADSI